MFKIMKKTRLILILSLCGYALILLAVSAFLLTKVRTLLVNYENAQPEYAVERQISQLKSSARNGNLDQLLTLSDSLKEEYDPQSPLFSEYIALLAEGTLTYERGYGSQSDCIYYDLFANDVKVATMSFRSTNERTDLIVFQSADWVPVSVDPVVYTCDLTLAEELTVKMGDRIMTGRQAEEGMVSYHLESLSKFSLTLSDGMGNVQNIENGSAPSVYSRSFTLPDTLTVRLNGTVAEGTDAGDGQKSYRFCSLEKFDLTVEDRYGHRTPLSDNADLRIQTFTATLPNDYTIAVGGITLSRAGLPIEYFDEFASFRQAYQKYFSDGAMDDAPGVVTYTFKCLMTGNAGKDIVITAPDGSQIPFDSEKGTVDVREESARVDAIPEEILNEIDVQKFAETWSYFLHNDLTGTRHGFNTMAAFLIKDSDFYKDCYAWATSVDIGLISDHTVDKTPFTDESFTGYRAFGENCFVCDIRLNLHITLTKTKKKLTRPLNRTVCFVRYDQTDDGVDNPKWYALACWDIIETEEKA